jgi:tryptophan halogenase
MPVPDSLAERMAIFAHSGRVLLGPGELFRDTSWVAVLLGQGMMPRGHDPLANAMPEEDLRLTLQRMRAVIGRGVEALPTHADFLGRRSPLQPEVATAD